MSGAIWRIMIQEIERQEPGWRAAHWLSGADMALASSGLYP